MFDRIAWRVCGIVLASALLIAATIAAQGVPCGDAAQRHAELDRAVACWRVGDGQRVQHLSGCGRGQRVLLL